MSEKKYTACKRYVVRGILALIGGSVLLFMPTFAAMPEFLATPLLFAACFGLLYGNGCIFYGLLIHAGPCDPQ